jgi:glycosyl transferase family 25
MFEFVEKVVYINLDHRTDRKQQVEEELTKYFSTDKIVRFSAIRHANPGVGCGMSHIAVLEMAQREGWKNVLILEDDAVWSNFDTGYLLLQRLIQNSWDVIMLGGTHCKYELDYKLLSGQTTTAYLVNSHYYTKLISNIKEGVARLIRTGNWPLYAIDQYWKVLHRNDKWYVVIPSLMIQSPSYSDIEKKNVDYRKEFS